MSDPYQALELERGADTRAIKSAYFRLMRLHPPEKEPEAFQRIRAAYELLSDPEQRAAFDAEQKLHDEHGEEAQAVLRASRECLSNEEPGKARDMLAELLSKNPAIHEARELLGFAFLRLDQAGPALQEFERLVLAEPKSVEYRIHVAQTLRILDQVPNATASARAALEIEPAHVEASILLGELLGAAGKWDEAFALWEKTLAATSSAVDVLRLRMCFVEAHLERHEKEATEVVFDQLAQELERRGDNDLRRFVVDRLSALSAQMFATERALAGNVLLRAAGRLSASPVFEAFLPSRIDVLLDDLPEASRKTLAKMVESAPKASFSWTHPWVLLTGAAAALGLYWLALSSATDPEPWGQGEVLGMALLAVPAGLFLALGALGLWRRRTTTQLVPYTLLHPLYLLRTGGEKVEAWPLIRLQSATVSDQHSNGAYVSTVVDLDFGSLTCRVPVAGAQPAREFAQSVLDGRGRALQLLARGLLAAEPSADLIPHALLPADRKPTATERARTWGRRKAWAAGLAVAVVLCAVSPFAAGRSADSSFGQKALESGSPRKLREYLSARPRGASVPAVGAALDRMYADRQSRAEARAGVPLPRLQKLLATLRADPRLELQVVDESPWAEGDPGMAVVAQSFKDPKQRNNHLVDQLRAALVTAVGLEGYEEVKGSGTRLTVRYAILPSGEWLEAPGQQRSPGLAIRCRADLVLGREPLVSAESLAGPDPSFTTTARTLREDPAVLQREMILSGLDACTSKLFSELALSAVTIPRHASVLIKPAPARESPYRGVR
ncbi:MAG TPA: DnaJ domain-containing protein [Myxococcales bacterium]|jgi:tetratricopeptide (TPR) repeat protein